MATPEVTNEYPRDLREMIVYEALLRAWGHVVLDAEKGDPFTLAKMLSAGHHIPPERMLDLNWAAYSDITAIEGLRGYLPKHESLLSTLD